MKINISRQYIYLITISLLLFLFVVVFAFSVLIPEGKEYRIKKAELNRELRELRRYESFHDETYEFLKNLQSQNRHIISAFDTIFDIERFKKQHASYFNSLNITKVETLDPQEDFSVYEVNTSSHISTPATFYKFLDAINKSSWIIGIDFPLEFKRDGDLIKSSFKMKVYFNSPESNASASESLDK